MRCLMLSIRNEQERPSEDHSVFLLLDVLTKSNKRIIKCVYNQVIAINTKERG